MDLLQQERLAELFEAAAQLPHAQRTAFLAANCADADMRAELQSLLHASDTAPDFLEQLAATLLPAGVMAAVPAPAEDLEPGQQVGGYEIVEPLGGGGMGVVYTAYDRRLDRHVALKIIPARLATDENARARLTYEARAASALDHPNICTVYDIGELGNGRLYLALAHYDGETLDRRIARGALAVDEARSIALQIAEGLSAAHRRGIVHRDIKPSNILITADGVVKLLDFGIAKMQGAGQVDEISGFGTIAYMSPEQTRGEAVDARTDVWSFGVVLYELLAGKGPFDHPRADLIDAIRRVDPVPITELRRDVSPALAHVLATCLQKDPSVRYQRADEVLADLRALADAAAPRSTPVRRVAVIPLRDDDVAVAYLADGVANELISRLSSIGGLRVIASASAATPVPSVASAAATGRELGADTVLVCDPRRADASVHIRLRLIDAGAARELWEVEHRVADAELSPSLRRIALQIAGALALDVQVHSAEHRQLARHGTDNAAAYSLYLRSRYYLAKRDQASVEHARECAEQALDLDPVFAQAWTSLGDAFSLLGSYAVLPADEAYPRARAAVERALAIDDELADAHASLATILADHYLDWQQAGAHYRRALALNPSYATAHLWYAGFLRDLGQFDQALEHARSARDLDPLSVANRTAEGITLYLARRYREALHVYHTLREVTPSFTYVNFLIALAHVQLGSWPEALEALRRAEASGAAAAGVKSIRGYVHAVTGVTDEARRVAAALEEVEIRQNASPFKRAVVHVGLGELDRALDLLHLTIAQRAKDLRLLRVEPLLDPLRADPRFDALLREARLTDEDVARALSV